jgi:sulfide dehydrogenase [flavocytochrome c] flavoprotein subunit
MTDGAPPTAGGATAADADARTRALEQQFALDWFRNITSDMFT